MGKNMRNSSVGGKIWLVIGILAIIGIVAVGYMGATASPPSQKMSVTLDGKQFGLQ